MTCNLCPRKCRAERGERDGAGFCGVGTLPRLARAAPHFGEEPCISGTRGSGTVFFSGCALGCVFCQNREISRGGTGEYVSVARLAEIFRELEDTGVHNLNLVTASHYFPAVTEALKIARPGIPVVYNTSGYDTPEALGELRDLVQVFLPDLKYTQSAAASRWSKAKNYPETAKAAILEMYRHAGPYVLDADGIMTRGVMVRHLVLPGEVEAALDVIDWVSDSFPKNSVMLSLMSQYTPMPGVPPELARPLSREEYERALSYFELSGLPGYFQEPEAVGEEEIPAFDLMGV